MSAESLQPVPLDAALRPIVEAQVEAAAQADRLRAKKAAAARREEDAASILRMYEREGLAVALRVGKAYGWTKKAIEELIDPPAAAPPRRPGASSPSGDAGGGGDGGSPPPAGGAGDDEPRRPVLRAQPVKKLPADCPVIPLGVHGDGCWYLGPDGRWWEIRKHDGQMLPLLFGRQIEWMWKNYPKFNERNLKQSGVKYDELAHSLIAACNERGMFDPAEKLRGPGAWRDRDGGLILHCGDEILTPEGWKKPGYHEGYIYYGAPALSRPMTGAAGPISAQRLLDLLAAWPWQWGDDDAPLAVSVNGRDYAPPALMLLGHIGCMLIGGALKWRPAGWVRGLEGSGKSTLQDVVAAVCGDWLVASSDATAAGIFQTLGYSSLAVAIDEAEADYNSKKMQSVVELLRQSASGGKVLRGSPDAKVRNFTVRSCFFLTSIIVAALKPQDVTRVAVWPLGQLTQGAAPKWTAEEMAGIGAALRRRILDQWTRWPETLERYRAALQNVGHDARGADQFGALYAMADILLFDGPADADMADACALTVKHLTEAGNRVTSSQSMLVWLGSKTIESMSTRQHWQIANMVRFACGDASEAENAGGAPTPTTARKSLGEHGIHVIGRDLKDSVVVLPNVHAGLVKLFDGSQWGSQAGAVNSGWSQIMPSLPGAKRFASSRIGGRGWSIPVKVFLTEMDAGGVS